MFDLFTGGVCWTSSTTLLNSTVYWHEGDRQEPNDNLKINLDYIDTILTILTSVYNIDVLVSSCVKKYKKEGGIF